MYIFLSHSSKDSKLVETACNYLENNGFSCFLAPRDIRGGHLYAEELVDGIDRSDVVILFLSKAANDSPHVLREIERAVSKSIPILVYKLEELTINKSMEYFLMTHQWINACSENELEELKKALQALPVKNKEEHAPESAEMMAKKQFSKFAVLALAILFIVFCVIVILVFGNRQDMKDDTSEKDAEIVQHSFKTGDTLVMGSYLGAPIEWRIIKVSEDGRNATLLSKYIVSMKAFDAAESGTYNSYEGKDYWGKNITGENEEIQRMLRGSNDWSTSNLRTWLNSSKENVVYEKGIPSAKAMSSLLNGYDSEAGFLNGFTMKEQEAICSTSRVTNGITTEEKVFLLSSEELIWLQEADVNKNAIPTSQALEQDKTDWYEIYALEFGVEDYFWWLRDKTADNHYEVYMVGNSYSGEKLNTESVGLEGFGVRPAITIDLNSEWAKEYKGEK